MNEEREINVNEAGGMNQYWDLEPVVAKNTGVVSKKQLSIKKKLLIILAVIMGIGMFCLCMIPIIKHYNRSRYKDEFYVEQEVMKYLEKRYGEEFVVMYNRGMGPAYNYVQLFAYPQGYTTEKYKFKIQGYYNKWGKLDYFDSYVMVKLTDEYEAYIDPIIGEYFDEYKFYMEFDSEWLTNNLPVDTKVEDLWRLNANVDYPMPSLFVYLAPVEKVDKNNIEELCTQLRDIGLRGHVKIWALKGNDKYQKLQRNDWQDNRKYNDIKDITTIFLYSDNVEIIDNGGKYNGIK